MMHFSAISELNLQELNKNLTLGRKKKLHIKLLPTRKCFLFRKIVTEMNMGQETKLFDFKNLSISNFSNIYKLYNVATVCFLFLLPRIKTNNSEVKFNIILI